MVHYLLLIVQHCASGSDRSQETGLLLRQHILIAVDTKKQPQHHIRHQHPGSAIGYEGTIHTGPWYPAKIHHDIDRDLQEEEYSTSGSHEHPRLIFLTDGYLEEPQE